MNRQWTTSKLTAFVLCMSTGGALAVALSSCSDSGSSASGAGGTENTGSGGATSTGVGGATNNSSGGATNNSSGGATNTGSGGSTSVAGCSSVDVSGAATGTWPVINVELVPAKEGNTPYTQVIGYPWDGPQAPELFTKEAEVGSCQLLKVSSATCSPPACNASAVTCVGNNEWARKPVKVASGNLTFTGLTLQSGGTSLTLSPIANLYQAAGSTAVAYPPCTAGSTVTVAGGAGTDNAYTLTAKCIDVVTVTSAEPMPFESGKAAQFTWTPATASNSRIAIEIDISHHGGLKGLIRCDVPDNGAATVDASLVTGLIGYGTAGFPEASLTRHSIGTATVGTGTATLDVKSTTSVPLSIPGVVSCSDTLPCPTGTCTSAKCQ
jgi:hypothetical protein